MATAKIAISIEESILNRLDLLVKSHTFPNRSKAIQEAIKEKLNLLIGQRTVWRHEPMAITNQCFVKLALLRFFGHYIFHDIFVTFKKNATRTAVGSSSSARMSSACSLATVHTTAQRCSVIGNRASGPVSVKRS